MTMQASRQGEFVVLTDQGQPTVNLTTTEAIALANDLLRCADSEVRAEHPSIGDDGTTQDAVEHSVDLVAAFHERTGRCLGGDFHSDCVLTEAAHRAHDHSRCISSDGEEPTETMAERNPPGRWVFVAEQDQTVVGQAYGAEAAALMRADEAREPNGFLGTLGERFVRESSADPAEAEAQFRAEQAARQSACQHRTVLEGAQRQRVCSDCSLWLPPLPRTIEQRLLDLEASVANLVSTTQSMAGQVYGDRR